MRPEFEANPYPESPGARERALDSVEQKIDSWPDVSPEFKALVKEQAESFISRRKTAGKTVRFYGGQLGWTHWIINSPGNPVDDTLIVGRTQVTVLRCHLNGPVACSNLDLFDTRSVHRKPRAEGMTVAVPYVVDDRRLFETRMEPFVSHEVLRVQTAIPQRCQRSNWAGTEYLGDPVNYMQPVF